MNPINQKNNFKVPQGYFEKLEQEINHKCGNEFSVPKAYFEKLEQEIASKTVSKKRFYIKTWLPYAAAVAAVLVVFFVWTNSADPIKTVAPNQELVAVEIIEEVYATEEESNPDPLLALAEQYPSWLEEQALILEVEVEKENVEQTETIADEAKEETLEEVEEEAVEALLDLYAEPDTAEYIENESYLQDLYL